MKTNDKRVSDFLKWCDEQLRNSAFDGDEATTLRALRNIGCEIKSVYEETDTNKLRSMLCKLVSERTQCGIKSSGEYISAIQLLTSYLEYLDSVQVTKEVAVQRDKTIDSLVFAYYLSRMNDVALKELNCKSFTDAFKKVAELLGQKVSTIKNMRDEFDPYFDNGRKGWYQRELRGTRREVYEKYKHSSDQELTIEIKKLIEIYVSAKKSKSESGHAKIKLSNKGMKEIKYKGK